MSGLMDILGGGLVKSVGDIIDDVYTSDEERAAADLESKKLDTQVLMGVHDTNKAEAQNASIFVAGWRPFIGWVCGAALGLVYIPKALALTGLWVYQAWVLVAAWNGTGPMPPLPPYPDLGVADLIGLIGAMLGMAGLRTKETLEGVARDEPLSRFPNPFKRKPAREPEAP
jgi:hypothetical protein